VVRISPLKIRSKMRCLRYYTNDFMLYHFPCNPAVCLSIDCRPGLTQDRGEDDHLYHVGTTWDEDRGVKVNNQMLRTRFELR